MLMRLTTGQWVNPENIVAIRFLEGSFSLIGETMHMPRVSVDISNGCSVIIDYGTDEEAKCKVDDLIDQISTIMNMRASCGVTKTDRIEDDASHHEKPWSAN